MYLPELSRYKTKYPELATAISSLEVYLEKSYEVERRVTFQVKDIIPALVGKVIGVPEGTALVLLDLAEEAGLLTHEYYVYCPDSDYFLGKFKTKEELPDSIECPKHDIETDHGIDEYFVEVVFHFNDTLYEKQRYEMAS